MPAQFSGVLLVAVFAVAAVAGAVLACRLVALSAPVVRHPPGRKVRRAPAPAGPEPDPAEPGGLS